MTNNLQKDTDILEKHILTEEAKTESIEKRLEAIEASMKEMTDAWTQAKGALQFIKILAGLAATGAAIYSFLTSNFTIITK